ncbi:MAG: DUF1788 domain-containing protein [Armatimonadetes bacterium]|nr:DUF1788 domain-containing protein [Armatimonadota bacterium]
MAGIPELIEAFDRRVSLQWQQNLSGREKVWFCIYAPRDERRLRARLGEFQLAAEKAGKCWHLVDLSWALEEWLARNEYCSSYFGNPELLGPALDDLLQELVGRLADVLATADPTTLTVILGVGSLFGFLRVSNLVEAVTDRIQGRLLVFFPGTKEGNNYRLLDARDGWNYLAVPIQAEEVIL